MFRLIRACGALVTAAAVGTLIAQACFVNAQPASRVWLASLDLSHVEQGWGKPMADRSVDGHPLTLGGRVFEHGLGTHSPGIFLVDLDGGSRRFTAWAGIDDETQKRGSVEFQIAGDGKLLWSSGIMRGGQPPKQADVDVSRIHRLALIIGDAGDGFEYDHADWADASFEVTGAAPHAAKPSVFEPTIAAPIDTGKPRITSRVTDYPARTPPLGWNSYDCFGDEVTETEVMANARYIQQHLRAHGWEYVVVDYRWYDPNASKAPNNANAHNGEGLTMDGFGRLLPSPNRFPSAADGKGFKPLADQIHGMGLKFGIHIMRGIPRQAVKQDLPIQGSTFHAADAGNAGNTCSWCNDMYGVKGDTEAGRAWYDSILRLYAGWGVDYIKVDDMSSPYSTHEIECVHNAIQKCGRSIVFSLSPGETPVEDGTHVSEHANLWRISGDFWDNWAAVSHQFDLLERWHGFGGPGHWPDADMIPLGHLSVSGRSVGPDRHTALTKDEQLTMMSLWTMAPSPMMLGMNLPDNDAWTLSLITNDEVLAVNQDDIPVQASRLPASGGLAGTEIWVRQMSDGSRVFGLFNRIGAPMSIHADLKGKEKRDVKRVRDLWQRKDLPVSNVFETVVDPHGAVLLRVEYGK